MKLFEFIRKDSISNCIPKDQCPCTLHGKVYEPGANYTRPCRSCICIGGRWNCTEHECLATCSLEGGSHITTFDRITYNLHGNCIYVLTKLCNNSRFIVEGRLSIPLFRQTVLTSVFLRLGGLTIEVHSSGRVYSKQGNIHLPFITDQVTIFQPTTHYIIVQVKGQGLQLQIQLVPIMQLYILLSPNHRGQMCGLCGNFNSDDTDDFMPPGGVREGDEFAYINSWKSQVSCPDAEKDFVDPCVSNAPAEQFADQHCRHLEDPHGSFADCHCVVNPKLYLKNCRYDACACSDITVCLCAVLGSYARACAAEGVILEDWIPDICGM
ncbi:mucin-2-like [Ambystoma mexicanum]|uniref:mucin-2-like n=1 Tax=Ambystoma mexicanum TaxID=8296 RepID=UPI0037E92D23